MAATDDRRPLVIRSPYDGSAQRAVLSLPGRPPRGPLPLVVAPHPFGWSVEEDYHGGCRGLKAPDHQGWRGVPSAARVAVLQPEGHHRAVAGCSLGWRASRDVAAWLDAVEAVIALDRDACTRAACPWAASIAALAGGRPNVFAAAFAFNPVVDVAAWQEDLARHRTPSSAPRAPTG
jgi:fermentation-respiration switch protein FrsA (DUF1100 family)